MKQRETHYKTSYFAKIGDMYVAFVRKETGVVTLSENKSHQAELEGYEVEYLSSKFENVEIKRVTVTVTTEEEVL